MMKNVGFVFLLLFSVSAIAEEKIDYVIPDTAALKFGRLIWVNNCEACYGYGVADAPIPMWPQGWKHRVAKGKTLLYRHAIDSFISEEYNVMPALGGNQELNDEHVKAAVDYMLFLANIYIKKEGEL